jgi:hypothetical protein
MEGQSVGENYRLAPQALRGSHKALWKRELDLASPKLATTAGISNDTMEKPSSDSTMKLTIHVLKDTRVGFKQVSYIERYPWIGKNKGIRFCMDHLDILSTYLPIFLPLKGKAFDELRDQQKAAILYDTLQHYYIKKMSALDVRGQDAGTYGVRP